MPVDSRFQEAAINQMARGYKPSNPWSGHRVLGRRLRPFSLWHRYLLRTIDSPLLGPAAPQLDDLDRAVSICRCRYLEVDYGVRHPLRLLWRAAAGGLERETAAFDKYVTDFYAPAEYTRAPSKADETAPPLDIGRPEHELQVAWLVIGGSHCSFAEAWEMPFGMADHYAALAYEASGTTLDFETEEKRTFKAQMKAKEERLMRESEQATFDDPGDA